MTSYSAISQDDARPGSSSSNVSRGRSLRRGRKDTGYAGEASWISSVINLVNTIVGAGVLAMPLALSHMGIFLGTLVILWSGLASGFGLYLQTQCARYLDRGTASFFALSQITYPNAAVVFDTAIAIKCFGVGISYLIIIGDLMPGVVRGFTDDIGNADYLLDRHFWVTAFMLIVIPLSFLRRLDSLKYTSVIALISIGYLVILVLAHFIKGDTAKYRGDIRVFEWAGAMFSILNEISNNSHTSTTAVVGASNGTAAFIYILVAITGYLSYGNNVGGNIVAMYAPSIASTIGKAAIVVLVMFSYPLQVHPCRASIDAILRWRPIRSSRTSPEASPSRQAPLLGANAPGARAPEKPSNEPMSELRFAIITTIIIVLSYVVAMTVSSLEKVLAYVGSTGSTSISFILPGLFYYKISSPDSLLHQRLMKEDDDEAGYNPEEAGEEEAGRGFMGRFKSRAWRKTLLRRASLGLAIYGLIVMITCLVTNTFFLVAH